MNRGAILLIWLTVGLLVLSGCRPAACPAPSPARPDAQQSAGLSVLARERKPPVTIEVLSRRQKDPAGKIHFTIRLAVDDGWHINSHLPLQDYLIPTSVLLEGGGPWEVENLIYPPGEQVNLAFSPEPLSMYRKTMEIELYLRAAAPPPSGRQSLTLKVTFQPCNDTSCVRPETVEVPVVWEM